MTEPTRPTTGKGMQRRTFLKAGLGSAILAPTLARASFAQSDAAAPVVRLGMVGIGWRGRRMLRALLAQEGIQIVALCDIDGPNLQWAGRLLAEASRPEPTVFAEGPEDFRRLCAQDDVDMVLCATPPAWRTEVCLAAIGAGKTAVAEPPLALEAADHQRLADAVAAGPGRCLTLVDDAGSAETLALSRAIGRGDFGALRSLSIGRHGGREEDWPHDSAFVVALAARWMGAEPDAARWSVKAHHLASCSEPLIGSGQVSVQEFQAPEGQVLQIYHDTLAQTRGELTINIQGEKGEYRGNVGMVRLDGRPWAHREAWIAETLTEDERARAARPNDDEAPDTPFADVAALAGLRSADAVTDAHVAEALRCAAVPPAVVAALAQESAWRPLV